MFDNRQTKAEIIAAASAQNERLVEALCEIQRLRALVNGAVAAERERCAKIAESMGAGQAGLAIAAAIRKQRSPTGSRQRGQV